MGDYGTDSISRLLFGFSTNAGLTGCSRQKTKPFNPELSQLSGFDDKNENGVIEKDAWYRASEGYREEADIDRDSKIVEAEAKYYLQNLTYIKEELKQPLTQDEMLVVFRLKLEAARKIEDSSQKAKALCDLASEMAEAELSGLYLERYREELKMLFEEALDLAQTINDSEIKAETISHINSNMAAATIILPSPDVLRIAAEKVLTQQNITDPKKRQEIIVVLLRHLSSPTQKVNISTSEDIDTKVKLIEYDAAKVYAEMLKTLGYEVNLEVKK